MVPPSALTVSSAVMDFLQFTFIMCEAITLIFLCDVKIKKICLDRNDSVYFAA